MQNPRSNFQSEPPKQPHPRQLVFIDDSGDPGFKLGQGSTDYFVIAGIFFPNRASAEKTAQIINDYKLNNNLPQNFEFRYYSTKKTTIQELIRLVSQNNFTIRVVVVDKEKLGDSYLGMKKQNFYNHIVCALLRNAPINMASIYLDGRPGKKY
ncbi:MAG: DUF3800 domain-containing protein, partial [Bifidobacteriaceae bacterium]|nr:DUF3800 domain-containing protein [Bifidobacteriaceae bacterium]